MGPTFVFLLSSLLLTTGQSTPVQYQTQTLTLTPLQFPTTTESYSNVLSPESASAGPATTANFSLHFNLVHRDSFLIPSNSTPEQVLRLRLNRDAARVFKISAAVAGPPPNVTRPKSRGFSSAVVSGLSQGSGEYFTRIGVGTPPTEGYMVLDTGSDIVWIQCLPCRRCYAQSDPIFNPNKSRTFSRVSCGSPLCHRLDVAGCDTRTKSCMYQVSYGDGSITTGDFATETLSFRNGARIGRVALGCGHDNEGLFVAAAGLLGLGRGGLSFPSQAGRRSGRMFSYCLVDRTSSASSSNPPRASSVVFGPSAVPRSRPVAFTPMLRNPKMDTFYYVELTGISVGGSRVPVSGSDLKLDPATGRGGVIVDSGTSVTRLARPVYVAMRDAFKAGTAQLKAAPGGFSLFDTCYDLMGKKEVKVPTVVMHFSGGAEVSLPAENYLIPVDTKGTFCFAFAGSDSGVSIVGNIQQQGIRVVFDAGRKRVGFAPRGC